MRILASIAIAAFLCAGATSASAAEKHSHGAGTHSHDKKPGAAAQHGGQFQAVDDHHGIEMVVTDASLVFHLSEDGKPLEAAGSAFKAVVQTDGGTKVYPLDIKGSTLTAKLDAPLPKGAKIVVSGKDHHQEALQARFVKE